MKKDITTLNGSFLLRFKSNLQKQIINYYDCNPFVKSRKADYVQIRQCIAYALWSDSLEAKAALKASNEVKERNPEQASTTSNVVLGSCRILPCRSTGISMN